VQPLRRAARRRRPRRQHRRPRHPRRRPAAGTATSPRPERWSKRRRPIASSIRRRLGAAADSREQPIDVLQVLEAWAVDDADLVATEVEGPIPLGRLIARIRAKG